MMRWLMEIDEMPENINPNQNKEFETTTKRLARLPCRESGKLMISHRFNTEITQGMQER